jgi:hypothetical protein
MSLKKVIEEYLMMKLSPQRQRDGELEIIKDFIVDVYELDEHEFYDKLNRAYRNYEKKNKQDQTI